MATTAFRKAGNRVRVNAKRLAYKNGVRQSAAPKLFGREFEGEANDLSLQIASLAMTMVEPDGSAALTARVDPGRCRYLINHRLRSCRSRT